MDYGKIFDEGVNAATNGQPETACPYRTDGSSRRAWIAGYDFERESQLEAWRIRGAQDFAAGRDREACPYVDDLAAEAWDDGWTDAQARAEAEAEAQPAGRRVDLTPTWASLVPAFVALIENGTAEGRAVAIAEIGRMAAALDEANAAAKER